MNHYYNNYIGNKAEFVAKLSAIVIGHFSIDPNVNIYQEHINIKAARNDLFEYSTDYNFYEQLVATFSFIGQVVLDRTETDKLYIVVKRLNLGAVRIIVGRIAHKYNSVLNLGP